MDVTGWAELRLSLLSDRWTVLIRLCFGAYSVSARGEFQMDICITGWLLPVLCLGFPPPVNVVNRAYQMDRLRMPIWSFYSKTYIVILTCPSDMFPPVLPTFACRRIRLRIEVQVWMEATLPGIGARRT